MFFILSKILAFLLTPQLHSVFCLIAAGLFSILRLRQLARIAVVLAVVLPLVYSWTFVGEALVRPLENQAAAPARDQLNDAAGFIVLGGFTGRPIVSKARGEAQIGPAGERFLTAIEMARLYPDKPVWFSGFSGMITPRGWSEAEITKGILTQIGLPPERFFFEDRSRNTAQNAAFMLEKAQPKSGETWVVITSASHMKRALASFRAAGWTDLIPYPVDFQTTPSAGSGTFSPVTGFFLIRTALHEHIGYLAYRLSGRI